MKYFLVFLSVLFLVFPAQAAMTTRAKQAYMVDPDTGAVLLTRDETMVMPPSSMSKLMTVYLVFEQLKNGMLNLEDEFKVSEKAWRKGGSKMFVRVGTTVKIEDLLRGVIVQSGNDACIVLAEGIAGSEEAFADLMNQKARDLGMLDSQFMNSTGWPDEGHLMTAKDLGVLAQRLLQDFPEYYHYFAETEFTYNKITQQNRNPLLYQSVGADGLKTGHTEAGGYGLVASARRGGRRLILVLNGLQSMAERAKESARLIRWGFQVFDNYHLFKKDDVIEQATVWMGTEETVPMVLKKDLVQTLPKRQKQKIEVKVSYDGPIKAPVKKGDPIGQLEVRVPNMDMIAVPLYAGADVEALGFFPKMLATFKHLVF